MPDTFNSKGMLSGPDTCLRIYSIQEVGGQKGEHEQFWGDFCASRAAASLLQLQITNWDIFRISTKPTSFRTLCFLSTWPRWWQAPRICNNERIGKNDENLWLFVVGIIWAGLACFPASKETPFKYLTTGLKGVNFVLEINSSPPLSQISVNTWAGQWSANRLHRDWPALPFRIWQEHRCCWEVLGLSGETKA